MQPNEIIREYLLSELIEEESMYLRENKKNP